MAGRVLRLEVVMNWEALLTLGGLLAAILIIVLVGVAMMLTVAVLWNAGWVRFWDHLSNTAKWYFRRLKWVGHTKLSTTTAVAFSLVFSFGIAAAFTFPAYWRVSLVGLLILPALFLAIGWCVGGEKVPNHRVRFACSFFEPTFALLVPSLGNKLMEAGLQALKAAI
jgi:hypothetical protein